MTPPPLPNGTSSSLTPEQRRGRTLVLGIFIGMVALDFGLIVLKAWRREFEEVFSSSVRLGLTIGLMYAVWIGQRWARWLMVGLAYVASALFLVMVVAHPHLLPFAMFGVFAAMGSLIGFPKSVSSFLTFQRQNR
jgi:hypothetical protein